MAEEFENHEARRAVERWDTEGGAQETERPAERAPDAIPGGEQTIPPGASGEGTHHRGDSTEE